jgi:glycosyltransferase involved in cell wall biosynthesis
VQSHGVTTKLPFSQRGPKGLTTATMRFACFGWVDSEAGSVASANHLLLETLLERGHEVDLFAEDGFVNPATLQGRQGYRYCPLPTRLVTRLAHGRDRAIVPLVLLNRATAPPFYRKLRNSVAQAHSRHAYDVLLFLGLRAQCRVDGLPLVEWVQGSSREEAKAFRSRRDSLVKAVGWPRYVLHSNYYRIQQLWDGLTTTDADLTICGSTWTLDSLARSGHDRRKLAALPYPIDFDHFSLSKGRHSPASRILHLGRCDPRKRVDLLLDSFRLVRGQIPQARLTAVGRPGMIEATIEGFAAPDLQGHVTYLPGVPRHDVRCLLGDADLLVQTSESENFGSSVAEALACGLPVVVGPTNGTADYIDPYSQVFNSYTPESVAEAILAALERNSSADGFQPERRRSHAMGLLSRASVTDRFEALLRERHLVR